MTQAEEYEEVLVENLSPAGLVEYARYGEVAIITELVNQGLQERLDGAVDERGNTMLHMFAANGYLDCIVALLEHATMPTELLNQVNKEGNTALHWACVAGQLEAVRLLMSFGPTVAIENVAYRTPICEAQQHKRHEILKYFEETLGRKGDEDREGVEESMGELKMDDTTAEVENDIVRN